MEPGDRVRKDAIALDCRRPINVEVRRARLPAAPRYPQDRG